MLTWLAITAFAGPPLADSAEVTVGAVGAYAPAVPAADLDLWFGQRLRWHLTEGRVDTTVLADSRFRLDLLNTGRLEKAQVRRLGVRLDTRAATIDLGRSLLVGGGPRLVDGVQLRLHPTPEWDVGLWAGLAPDLFTTRPMLRPGAGPILAYRRSWLQVTTLGEVTLFDGALDRAGWLTQLRVSLDPLFEAYGRLDVQLTEAGPGLADASLLVRVRPTDSLSFDVLSDSYSSLRYLQSEARDPDLRRFDARLDGLGLAEGITQDSRDPRLYHLFGVSGRWAAGGAWAPRVHVDARYRWHPQVDHRFARLGAGVGVVLADGLVDLELDAQALQFDQALQADVGATAMVGAGPVGVDTSFRLVAHPAYGGRLGQYADLFADLVLSRGARVRWHLVGGAAITVEPVPGEPDRVETFTDVGYSGFLTLSARVRARRPEAHGASRSESLPAPGTP